MNPGQLLVSKAEAAELLGLSVRTLNRLIAGGRIGPVPVKLGGVTRFRLVELREWAASTGDGELPDRAAWATRKGGGA